MNTEPFQHQIRVTWAHCDPAKIVYTGHLPARALDGINAWWEAHLGGDGFFQLELDRNIGTPFVNLNMDFNSPVTPRHMLVLSVWPEHLGEKSIRFRVQGHQDDVLCFEGSFTSVFIVADTFKSQVAPDEIRAIIEPLLRKER
jgi:4-hydroxybenzoyl-CoA thioesterase